MFKTYAAYHCIANTKQLTLSDAEMIIFVVELLAKAFNHRNHQAILERDFYFSFTGR